MQRKSISTIIYCVIFSVVTSVLYQGEVYGNTYVSEGDHIVKISAMPDTLLVECMIHSSKQVQLVELRPYETFNPEGIFPVVWEGEAGENNIQIPRFDGKRDRLYSKFQMVNTVTGEASGHARYVTDIDAIIERDFDIPWPESKKGLTCITDIDDAIATGTKYSDEGVLINALIDWDNPEPEFTWEVDGHAIPINMDYVRGWMDTRYRHMYEGGINFMPILIHHVPREAQPGNPLIHPNTDLVNTPMRHGAFNLLDEEGLRCYIAAIEFIADRYTRPDRKYGLISGITIGNEIQSHWVWHNMGEASPEQVAEEYVWALRIADLAARRFHGDLKIYVSMEHHWTKRGHTNNPLHETRGDELLLLINEWGHREGNFPWHLNHHPYPENLFEPRFWLDRTATHRFDTPRITYKNLEVLVKWMNQPEFLYDGAQRTIVLGEQGFHTPDTEDGQKIQAAAFAYAHHKIRHMPEISAHIMHRHTSMRDEGGLDLGLWTWDPEDPHGARAHERKYIWEVYKHADTDKQEEAFAFALPIIGIENWDEALPNYDVDMTPSPVDSNEDKVFDFYENMQDARLVNQEVPGSFRPEYAVVAAGWLAPAIFHHPPAEGVGKAHYTVPLPEVSSDKKLYMRFETGFMAETQDGVGFSVLVNSETLWEATQSTLDFIQREIDITAYAGEEVEITLLVDKLEDLSYDWALWVMPRIELE